MRSGEVSKMRNLDFLYRSPNIARVIKYSRLGWTGHVVRMEEGRSVFNILTGNPILNRA